MVHSTYDYTPYIAIILVLVTQSYSFDVLRLNNACEHNDSNSIGDGSGGSR